MLQSAENYPSFICSVAWTGQYVSACSHPNAVGFCIFYELLAVLLVPHDAVGTCFLLGSQQAYYLLQEFNG